MTIKTPASPRRDAHERSRHDILRAARALVLKHGHEQLSLREVAKRAGYSPASLYEYFESKQELVRALATQANAALAASLRAVPATTAAAALVELGLAYIAHARAHGEDFLLMFGRLPSGRRGTQEAVPEQSAFRPVVEAAERALQEGVMKRSRGLDADRVAYAVWATAHGLAMLQLTHLAGFDADFAAADRETLQALVDGLRR